MKVAAQEIENSQVVLDIEVEDERMERAVEQAYRRIVQRLNVPGFRKGKAPRALVERMVGREALVEDAVELLVPQVVEDAVKQQELVMVARPSLEIVSTQPLQVKATVPVQPKVELGDYQSLKVEATPADVTDEQVEAVVTRLQESNATWEPVERAVELGDRIAIDLLAKAGETTVMESKDAEYVVVTDGPQPAEGFAEALVGQAIGETRNLTLKLPDEYRDKELAGQDAEFTVTVNWVKAKVLPALDDTLPTVVGTEFASLDALRSAVRENLSAREEHERRVAHEEKVLQTVVDQATLDLPPQLVEEEAGRIVQALAQNLEAQGIPLQSYLRFTQKTEEEFRAEMMAQAERSVRRSEVLNAVALAEGVEITDDEILAQLTASMEDTNENRKLIRDSLRRPQVKERVAASMRREKAIRLLLETIGGVDFAALEAEAAAEAASVAEAAEDNELADPVDEAADEVEVAASIEEVDAAVQKLSTTAATGTSAEATAADTDEKPAQASGDTPA